MGGFEIDLREESIEPRREIGGGEDAADGVGFGKARGKEIFT
jgi:hypothetical protein